MGDLTVKPVLVPTSVILKSSVASCLQFVHFCFPAAHCCTQPVHPSPISPTLFPHIHPPQRPYFFNCTTPSPSTLLPPTHPPICSHLKQPAAHTPPTTLIPNHPPYSSATHQLSDSATPQQAVCGKRKMRQRLKFREPCFASTTAMLMEQA